MSVDYDVEDAFGYVTDWEGRRDHEYEVVRPNVWVFYKKKGQVLAEGVDKTNVYLQENGKSLELRPGGKVVVAKEVYVDEDEWLLRPGKTYLVVRLRKGPEDTEYHVMAFCYKVNEDGTVSKKKVYEQSYSYPYSMVENYAERLKGEIDCEEYFK